MNRRQKIIVSVTGIFIVLLVLLGLTYAYFLTRITGNSNPTSISVTTANLELVYGDGTTAILTSNTPIEPGKFSSSKDFTVTNNGNALTEYAVTLEDFAVIYANDTVIDGVSVKAGTVTKMEYPGDMEMEITCTIESEDEDRNGTSCSNTSRGMLPIENSILVTNDIEVGDTHKYVLTLTYVDSGIDQSADMNKTIKGKIDIIDPKSTIDIRGTVATYEVGDYVEINSTPIKSEIIDGKYKLVGVEPGSHTLYIKYKDENGEIQTRGSQTLTIKKGEEASVLENTITFTEQSRNVIINLNGNYQLTIDKPTSYINVRDLYEHQVGYSNQTGIIDNNKNSRYVRIPVNEGEEWVIWYPKTSIYTGGGALRYENSVKEMVSYVNLSQQKTKININPDSDILGVVVKIPAGVSYMCLNIKVGTNIDATDSAIFAKLTNNKIKWTAFGDSITEFNNTASHNYISNISNILNLPVTNLGASGYGYFKEGGYMKFFNIIPNDTNFITIYGSLNDLSEAQIGTSSDQYVEGGNNTIAAYINYTYEYLKNNYPNAKIAVIIPAPWHNTNPSDITSEASKYINVLKEICEIRNIPYLDLFKESGMMPWDANYKVTYYNASDGVHPNNAGHEILTSKIVSFIKSVLEN